MKKILLVFVVLSAWPAFGQIQYLDAIPTAGVHFGGRLRFYEGEIRIDNAASYGVTLQTPINWGVSAEFTYSRSDSKARFVPYTPGYEPNEVGIASNYFLVGAVKEMVDYPIIPYGGFTLGVAWFDVQDPNIHDDVRFSIAFTGGVKYMLSDRIGIRVQGRFLMPLYFAGAGFYVGSGGGGFTMNTGGTMLQGDISVGLIFRLGGTGDY